MLIPPTPMIAGKGPAAVPGYETVAEKEMDFPPSETLTVKVLPDNDPVTDAGLGGRVPSSNCWKSWKISWRRQSHCALVVTLVPSKNVKGSGRKLLVRKVGFDGSVGQPLGAGPAVAVVEGMVFVTVVGMVVGTGVGVVGGVVVGTAPGRHCEYQSFCLEQEEPETQVVGPVQPIPPPDNRVSRSVFSTVQWDLHWPQTCCWARAGRARIRAMKDCFKAMSVSNQP